MRQRGRRRGQCRGEILRIVPAAKHKPQLESQLNPPGRFSAAPATCLQPFVHSYWGIRRDLSRVDGFTVTPDRFLEVVFFEDPPFTAGAARRMQLPACALIGLLSQPLHLGLGNMIRCASIRLYAWSAPKQLSSLARFQFVRDSIWAKPTAPLVSMAIDAGYADQAHMTREFRKYAGQTPVDLRRHCSRLKRVLSSKDVAFIQDRGCKPRQSERHDDRITHY
jgi:AraC-like DNA-binding protein